VFCARFVFQRSGGFAHEHGQAQAGDFGANAIDERIARLIGEKQHAPPGRFARRSGHRSRSSLRGRKAKPGHAKQCDAKGGDASGWAFERSGGWEEVH
jgi:hypothetical protein